MKDRIIVYTDGAALNNGSPNSGCGWACKLMYRGVVKLNSSCDIGKTNNQMEMLAVLNAMKSIKRKDIPVDVFSDSKYVIETLNGVYKISKNADLWKLLLKEKMKFRSIKFIWVKEYDEDEHSIEVNKAAGSAARMIAGRAVIGCVDN